MAWATKSNSLFLCVFSRLIVAYSELAHSLRQNSSGLSTFQQIYSDRNNPFLFKWNSKNSMNDWPIRKSSIFSLFSFVHKQPLSQKTNENCLLSWSKNNGTNFMEYLVDCRICSTLDYRYSTKLHKLLLFKPWPIACRTVPVEFVPSRQIPPDNTAIPVVSKNYPLFLGLKLSSLSLVYTLLALSRTQK